MSFAHPWAVNLAFLAPLVMGLFVRFILKRRRAGALRYSHLPFMLAALGPLRKSFQGFVPLWLLGVAFLGLSASGPHLQIPLPASDAAVVLCIDTSGSMRARDLFPSRSVAAASAARDFIDALPDGVRVGVVSFSSSAAVISPLIADHVRAIDALNRLPEPSGATAIGDALAIAVRQLPSAGPRAIILITDGANNAGVDPLNVADRAVDDGVAIYTVGVGTPDSTASIPGSDDSVGLDEDTLRAIAHDGARYVRVGNTASLQSNFVHLAKQVAWRPEDVDVSLGSALLGGLLVVIGSLLGLAFGAVA